jgi:hypothetical protein
MDDAKIVGLLGEILAELQKLNARAAARAATTGAKVGLSKTEPAPDSDLDTDDGNPVVDRDPPQWLKNGGASMVGKRLSETSAEYCDAWAAFEEWKARKDTESGAVTSHGKPKAPFSLRRAARGRGWELRHRNGHPTTKQREPGSDDVQWEEEVEHGNTS